MDRPVFLKLMRGVDFQTTILPKQDFIEIQCYIAELEAENKRLKEKIKDISHAIDSK